MVVKGILRERGGGLFTRFCVTEGGGKDIPTYLGVFSIPIRIVGFVKAVQRSIPLLMIGMHASYYNTPSV